MGRLTGKSYTDVGEDHLAISFDLYRDVPMRLPCEDNVVAVGFLGKLPLLRNECILARWNNNNVSGIIVDDLDDH